MPSIWYLGPPGDLRALPCPERGIVMTPVRYGGIQQALSGSRTLDITGIRKEYDFNWTNLDWSEYQWLEAMHTRQIPGPFRMVDPMRVNRLTPEASYGKPSTGTDVGVQLTSGFPTWAPEWPSAAGPGYRSIKWSSYTNGSALRFDREKLTTIFPLETITGSVYARSASNITVVAVIDWYDRNGVQLTSSATQNFSITTAWQRFSIARTAPAGATMAVFALVMPAGSVDFYYAAGQINTGNTALPWQLGGAAPVCHIDQLSVSSNRDPLRNCSMTLLET